MCTANAHPPATAAGKEGILLERKIPENICRIGRTDTLQRIYVEDYVISFLKEILKDMEHAAAGKAMLLLFYGDGFEKDGVQFFFLSGMAVRAGAGGKGFHREEQRYFDRIRRRFFPDKKGIGWYYLTPGRTTIPEIFRNLREQHFSDVQGYYIYYEKNTAMEEYLLHYHQAEKAPMPFSDKVKKKAGKAKESKLPDGKLKESGGAENGKPVKRRRRRMDKPGEDLIASSASMTVVKVMNAVSLCVLIICCIIAVTTLNQYDKMKRLEQTVICLEESLKDYQDGVEERAMKVESLMEQDYSLQDDLQTDR